jgi:flagellar P-ring protein FlgI
MAPGPWIPACAGMTRDTAHCPLPTAHCPLPTAHDSTAMRTLRRTERRRTALLLTTAAALALGLVFCPAARGQTLLKNICRVKGQEEQTLQGLGIVVGLKGTGDGGSFLPTLRGLSKVMTVMGHPLSQGGMAELKDTRNVALVLVNARVPAAGARQGDRIDCVVSSVGSAKSLEGGQLFLTPLIGPQREENPRIYAFAQGPVALDNAEMPTTGRVFRGGQLEEDFHNAFSRDGMITLVIDQNHADFQIAQDIAELINNQLSFQTSGLPLARALNQVNVAVEIPAQYRDDPVMFVSQVLSLPLIPSRGQARVVINERAGSIVISGDVEIGEVVVTHKNVVVEAGGPAWADRFVAVDPGQRQTARLKSLVEALGAIHVPTADVIDIIKGLDRDGKLYAKLIIE